MNRRTILTTLLAAFVLSGMAQTEEPSHQREKWKWAVDGILLCLAPDFEYYDKDIERYNPPVPWVWLGPSQLNCSLMGDGQAPSYFRSGFNKLDMGFTILQISRNLYRGVVGVSAGFQVGGNVYNLSRGYGAKKEGYHVEIAPADDEHKSNDLSFSMLRIPLLIGAQTNNRLFSLQTGLGLCLTSRLGAQWLVTAGLGPVIINYSRNLTPLFKLSDGTKAYPSSFTIGVDVWYYFCRFTHPK